MLTFIQGLDKNGEFNKKRGCSEAPFNVSKPVKFLSSWVRRCLLIPASAVILSYEK